MSGMSSAVIATRSSQPRDISGLKHAIS